MRKGLVARSDPADMRMENYSMLAMIRRVSTIAVRMVLVASGAAMLLGTYALAPSEMGLVQQAQAKVVKKSGWYCWEGNDCSWTSGMFKVHKKSFTVRGTIEYSKTINEFYKHKKTLPSKKRTFKVAKKLKCNGSDWYNDPWKSSSRNGAIRSLRPFASRGYGVMFVKVKNGKVVRLSLGG